MTTICGNTSGTIQISEDLLCPARKSPSTAQEKQSGMSDVEQGNHPQATHENFDFDSKRKQVRLEFDNSLELYGTMPTLISNRNIVDGFYYGTFVLVLFFVLILLWLT